MMLQILFKPMNLMKQMANMDATQQHSSIRTTREQEEQTTTKKVKYYVGNAGYLMSLINITMYVNYIFNVFVHALQNFPLLPVQFHLSWQQDKGMQFSSFHLGWLVARSLAQSLRVKSASRLCPGVLIAGVIFLLL